MHILHILDDLKPSGAEVMLRVAASFWHKQGIETDILSTASILGEYTSALERSGYKIYHIPFVPSSSFLLNIFRLFKKQHYDIIHIHSERANFWYALLAYIAGNRQLVRTIHNVFSFRKTLRIERYLQRWIMRRVLGVKMVSIGPSVKNTEWEFFRNPSLLIPNWFDNTKFKPPSREERFAARKSLGIPTTTTIFTSIGGCWPHKNHSSIIQAVASLPESATVAYIHVGPEAQGYPERKLTETIGASNRVHFLGSVLDVVPILYASDIYIMPSLYEGFSIAAIEAMGAGLPAILSDVPGLCDFREICKGIYWIEPTSESIAEAIIHFLDMPDKVRNKASSNLSAYIHRHFSIENGAGKYMQLYRRLSDRQIY